jgi:hypothetical protein
LRHSATVGHPSDRLPQIHAIQHLRKGELRCTIMQHSCNIFAPFFSPPPSFLRSAPFFSPPPSFLRRVTIPINSHPTRLRLGIQCRAERDSIKLIDPCFFSQGPWAPSHGSTKKERHEVDQFSDAVFASSNDG